MANGLFCVVLVVGSASFGGVLAIPSNGGAAIPSTDEADPILIDSCTTITTPGVYALMTNLTSPPTGPCIIILTSNVVFDGRGHTIAGEMNHTPARVPSHTGGISVHSSVGDPPLQNVTVRNLTIRDWKEGPALRYNGVTRGRIENVTLTRNQHGIILNGCHNITVTEATVADNQRLGIELIQTSNSVITDTTVSNTTLLGIYLTGASDNTIRDTISTKNGVGIRLSFDSMNNVIVDTTLRSNHHGIQLELGSHNNTLLNNTIRNTSDPDMTSRNSSDNDIANSGISLGSVNGTIIIGNTIVKSEAAGIALWGVHNTTIANNIIRKSGTGGLVLHEAADDTNPFTTISATDTRVYNNVFINQRNVISTDSYDETEITWNHSRLAKPNIVGGPTTGGNYWGHPDGTGYSQTCTDADRDGICDKPYQIIHPDGVLGTLKWWIFDTDPPIDMLPLTTPSAPESSERRPISRFVVPLGAILVGLGLVLVLILILRRTRRDINR